MNNPENSNRPDDINPLATAGSEYPEGLAHSGIYGEKPIIEYPEPLEVAAADPNMLHDTPDDPGIFIDGKLKEDDKPRTRKGLKVGAAVVAGLSLVGGGIFAGTKISEGGKAPELNPTAEAPITPKQTAAPTEAPVKPTDIPTTFEPTPVETETPVPYETKLTSEGRPASPDQIVPGDHFMPIQHDQEQDLSIENLMIPATLEGQDLARAVLYRTTAWDMAGAMPSMEDSDDYYELTTEAYATKIAQKNVGIFTEALISTPILPEMQAEIDRFTATNELNLGGYQQTYDPAGNNPKNLESIWVYSVLDGDGDVVFHQTGDDTWKLAYNEVSYNNTDKNIAPDTEVLINGYHSRTEVALVKDGDHWKIQKIKYSPN